MGSIGSDSYATIGAICSTCSIICWMAAGLPQYWQNYKNKSVEAISVTFIIIRASADIGSLIASILEGLPVTTVAVSSYFIIDDCIMFSQMYYYSRRKYNRDVSMGTAGQTPNVSRKSVTMLALTLLTTSAITGTTLMSSTSSSLSSSRSLLEATESVSYAASNSTIFYLTMVLAWGSNLFGYFLSRVPQVIKNYRQQSCDGLSMRMFAVFALANIFYGLSVILNTVSTSNHGKFSWGDWCVGKLPFLIGSVGTLAFDVAIIIQGKIYNSK